MSCTFRSFLVVFAILASVSSAAWGQTPAQPPQHLRILVLGGTGFLGPATIEYALARGHKVTMFNRGKTRPELFPDVEKLQGDRDPKKGEGLNALEKGQWDVVIDNSAYFPRMVTASAGLLADRCKQYILISTISAYKTPNPLNGDESAPLATMPDPTLETMGNGFEYYGSLKALCERAAEKAMPGRVTIVRPGFIVGPDDPSGRFTYWPVRFSRGGEIAVPGAASDAIQIIDVRDLGAWLVTLAENRTYGTFNACGPEKPMRWGQVVEACRKLAPANSRVTWLPAAFLAENGGPGFPIWVPNAGEEQGMHTWSNAKAVKAGLKFRPVEQTLQDTLDWYRSQEKLKNGRKTLAGPAADAEKAALNAWKAKSAPGKEKDGGRDR
jgi:2'-hydroxyisoflavone reductase